MKAGAEIMNDRTVRKLRNPQDTSLLNVLYSCDVWALGTRLSLCCVIERCMRQRETIETRRSFRSTSST